jgi:DnaJ-class molecular chaperone
MVVRRKGQRIILQNTPFGQVRQAVNCGECNGNGRQYSINVVSVRSGTVVKEELIDINIPAGVGMG